MIRAFQIAFISCLVLCLKGCKTTEQTDPTLEQVKIGDIAPSHRDRQPIGELPNTMYFDVHIFEIPAENAGKIIDLWGLLNTKPLQFNSFEAFRANSFVVRFGRVRMWDRIHDLLLAAGGQKIVTVSLMLSDGQANDLIVTVLNTKQSVSYVAANGSQEAATVGPGTMVLRIKAEKVPELKGVCKLIAYPVFTVPLTGSVPQISARAKLREFPFSSAAFGLRMAPGDFVVLGPEKYISSQTTLASLFFSKPEGSLFPSTTQRIAPQLKPAIRVFLLACSRIT